MTVSPRRSCLFRSLLLLALHFGISLLRSIHCLPFALSFPFFRSFPVPACHFGICVVRTSSWLASQFGLVASFIACPSGICLSGSFPVLCLSRLPLFLSFRLASAI